MRIIKAYKNSVCPIHKDGREYRLMYIVSSAMSYTKAIIIHANKKAMKNNILDFFK